MAIVETRKSGDQQLLDEVFTGPGSLRIRLAGIARYEISLGFDSGQQLTVGMWTSRKGSITTTVDGPTAAMNPLFDERGNLQSLVASNCSIHLEHMDRGHYWLGITHAGGDVMHVHFQTSGYLKTKVLQ